MADHLEFSTQQSNWCSGSPSKQDIAHVAHGAVGHHPLHIGLGNGGKGSIDHRNGGPDGESWGHQGPGLGE